MELNYSKIFNKVTLDSVDSFCKLNGIDDIENFIKGSFNDGFNIKKYGLLGKTLNDGEKDLKTGEVEEKQLIKEVIVEKRVEVPVEVIKEVEKIVEVIKEVTVDRIVEVIKEVPVEKVVIKEIIKEVPIEKVVTKIEYISDKESENELLFKIQQLEQTVFQLNDDLESERQEFSTKTQEMVNIFQDDMFKKDESLDELRRSLDVKQDDNKLKMLQDTIQTLSSEVRGLKKKNEELENKLLDLPNQPGEIPAKFHGSSNLNNNLYK